MLCARRARAAFRQDASTDARVEITRSRVSRSARRPAPRRLGGALAALHRRIELRRLLALEHAVVADDAHVALARRDLASRPPALRGLHVAPRDDEHCLAGRVDALEQI